MNSKLFRQISLERLSSPDQLDQVLKVTSFRTWLAMLALFLVLAATTVWAFTASIPSTVTGQGLILKKGGVVNVIAQSGGVILELNAKPGDHVKVNQVIATLAQPVLSEKMRALQLALQEAQQRRTENLQQQNMIASMQAEAFARQKEAIELQIKQLDENTKITNERIEAEQQLLAKGLVTRQQVIAIQRDLASIREQITSLRVQQKQIDSQALSAKLQPSQSDAPMASNVASIERDLAGLRKEVTLAESVVSPYAGEVLEVKSYPGSAVTNGEPVLSIQPDETALEIAAYLPSVTAKDAHAGQEIRVSPLNIKREEYGVMLGDVTFVAGYPATPEALMRVFENRSLVDTLISNGAVTEVRATLRPDKTTVSGFQWSTRKGPNIEISSGTICLVQIVTRRQTPATLVFPYMKQKLGVD